MKNLLTRRFWKYAVVILLGATAAGAATIARFSGSLVTADQGGAQSACRSSSACPNSAAKLPRLVVADNVYDFGVMTPGEKRKHSFTVSNVGEADLTLDLEKTTCKCTLADLGETVISPGESTEIELEWHAEEPQFRFRQAAVIRSNDPEQARFELAVAGSIRVKLGAVPEEGLFIAQLPKNTARTVEVLLYSQYFDQIEVRSVTSSLDSLKAELVDETADAAIAALPEESRYYRTLKVTKAPENKIGPFEAKLRIEYVGSYRGGKEEAGVFEFPVAGETIGDLSIHGRDVIGTILHFGVVAQAEGAKKKAYVHVRGDRPVEFEVAGVTPKFLQVEIGRRERLSATMSRVPIEVSIPSGSPQMSLLNYDVGLGEVVLKTTHPEHAQVRFQVTLTIAP